MNTMLAQAVAPLQRAVAPDAPSDKQALTLETLSRAMADNALLNSEVDQKILARLLETQEELKATNRAVQQLRRQFAQLVRSLGQVMEVTRVDLEAEARKKS